MSSIPFPPKLTVNRSFMKEFIEAEPPCMGIGLVEEQNRQCGFLALRPAETIPPEVSAGGFNFGHSLLGTEALEVIYFGFEFYGFKTYNVAREATTTRQPSSATERKAVEDSRRGNGSCSDTDASSSVH